MFNKFLTYKECFKTCFTKENYIQAFLYTLYYFNVKTQYYNNKVYTD
jgi:hypothetical protein